MSFTFDTFKGLHTGSSSHYIKRINDKKSERKQHTTYPFRAIFFWFSLLLWCRQVMPNGRDVNYSVLCAEKRDFCIFYQDGPKSLFLAYINKRVLHIKYGLVSSVGQSAVLITRMSWVRPPYWPKFFLYHHSTKTLQHILKNTPFRTDQPM